MSCLYIVEESHKRPPESLRSFADYIDVHEQLPFEALHTSTFWLSISNKRFHQNQLGLIMNLFGICVDIVPYLIHPLILHICENN